MTSSGPDGAPVRTRTSSVIRVIGFVLAVGLGGAAVWLIVTSTSQKHIEIGVLAGLWGLLLGAYSAFGSRPHAVAEGDPGTALELRSAAALARADDVVAQQAFQARLEAILRREVQQGVARELVGLREEVSSLRSEILEKVGGQLRMERTETTRLFGSGLEELQREVRQLKVRQYSEPDVVVSRPAAVTVDAEEVADVEVVEVVRPRAAVSVQKPAESDGAARPMRPASAFETVDRGPDPVAPAMPPPAPLHTWPPIRATAPAPAPAAATAPATVPAPAAPPVQAPPPVAPQPEPEPRPYVPPMPQPFATPVAAQAPAAPAPVLPAAVPPAAVAPEPAPAPTPPSEPAPLPRFELPPVPRIEVPTVPRFDPASFAPAVDPVTPIPGTENADIFASMPRLKPFTDFELEPVDRVEDVAPQPEPQDEAADARIAGRHSTPAGESGPRAGGRRHRSEDGGHDMLARILERERR